MKFKRILLEELPHQSKSAKLTSMQYKNTYEYNFKIGEVSYVANASLEDEDEDVWEFSFFTAKSGDTKMLGTGNVGKVLSSALKALISFAKKQKPKKIVLYLPEDSEGRKKAYDLLLSKQLVPGYYGKKGSIRYGIENYILHRKDK